MSRRKLCSATSNVFQITAVAFSTFLNRFAAAVLPLAGAPRLEAALLALGRLARRRWRPPAVGRDLLNPHRRVQRPERPSAPQFSQSGCRFTVLLYVAGSSDSAPRDSSPSLFERVLVVEVL